MPRYKYLPSFIVLLFTFPITTIGQVLTPEDSLSANLLTQNASTVISGYGEVKYQYDLRYKTGTANLTRAVLFVGHRFNSRISVLTEMELEDAKIEGGEASGEISMEQVYLKFNLNKDAYLTAGLFTPRIGIINENHLPTTFNGNDRPFVERYVIPATWREIGVALYGSVLSSRNLNYSLAIVNGLNSAGFENGTGIREGRFEGSDATASNLAVTGSLLYYYKDFRVQASGYFGGSAGLSEMEADSLQLESGMFGTPVSLVEANVQYNTKAFSVRALVASVSIPDAATINRAYANNTPESIFGAYVEAGVNLLNLFNRNTSKNLTLFARYETMDLNKSVPENGISDDLNKKDFIVAGLTFKPIHGVAIKADYVYRETGVPNPVLQINPFPQAPPYYTTNSFFNLGFGYSF